MSKITPFIKVEWIDVPENFTEEKANRIKHYFQNKYNSNNVKIINKISSAWISNAKLASIDSDESITDYQYQKKLIKDYIKDNNIEVSWEQINKLDNRINSELDKLNQNKVKYRRWYIKKIEFSNILSFGENNVLNFNNLNGITVIESRPSNFSGKCVDDETTIDIEFDENEILNKLGHIPDELK
jgi:hypothetical protein